MNKINPVTSRYGIVRGQAPSLFDIFFESDFLPPTTSASSGAKRSPISSYLSSSLDGEDDAFVFRVEAPGMEASEIKVKIEGRMIYVETPKGVAYETLGQRVRSEDAKATLKRGVLTVTIPKREAKVLEITVTEE